VIRKGIEPKATTVIAFTGSCTYSPETRVALRGLTDAFELRLVETLREKLGGTYSPSVGGGCSRRPHQEYNIEVQFQSSPENVEPLTRAVFALVDTLRQVGPAESDVERVREQILRSREVNVRENGYWLSGIVQRLQSGEDLAGLLEPYDALVRQLTPASLRAAARRYLDPSSHVRFVLLPEATPDP
jgi:zinc protease